MNLRFSNFSISKPAIARQKPNGSAPMALPFFGFARNGLGNAIQFAMLKFENVNEPNQFVINGIGFDLKT